MIAYEQYLNEDKERAFLEGSLHFENASKVQIALRRIASRLDEIGVPYAIAGAMALFYHGYRRFTEDVDVVLAPEGYERILADPTEIDLVPCGRTLRDAETGVRVDFMRAGSVVIDGLPGLLYPDPRRASVRINWMSFLSFPKLIDLKLAVGTHAEARLKDLGDVQEAMKRLDPPAGLAAELHPALRSKYLHFHRILAQARSNGSDEIVPTGHRID